MYAGSQRRCVCACTEDLLYEHELKVVFPVFCFEPRQALKIFTVPANEDEENVEYQS